MNNLWRKAALLIAAGVLAASTFGSGRMDIAREWRDLLCPVVPTDICWVDFYEENPDGGLTLVESIPFLGWENNHINVLPEIIIDPE